MWKRIVHWIGGVYDVGLATLCIHDRGVLFAWDRVVWWEWRVA